MFRDRGLVIVVKGLFVTVVSAVDFDPDVVRALKASTY